MKIRLKYASAILAGVLFLLHAWQSWKSGWDLRPIVRAAYCMAYIPVVLSAGSRVIPWAFTVFALVLELTSSFDNYTPFIMILLAGCLLPKYKYHLIGAYGIACTVSLMIQDKQASHCLIHILNCIAIWYTIKTLIYSRIKESPLDLTESERKILDQMLDGKQQKEIQDYSQNTITKKLRQARDRNGIKTTAELLMRYAAEKAM